MLTAALSHPAQIIATCTDKTPHQQLVWAVGAHWLSAAPRIAAVIDGQPIHTGSYGWWQGDQADYDGSVIIVRQAKPRAAVLIRWDEIASVARSAPAEQLAEVRAVTKIVAERIGGYYNYAGKMEPDRPPCWTGSQPDMKYRRLWAAVEDLSKRTAAAFWAACAPVEEPTDLLQVLAGMAGVA